MCGKFRESLKPEVFTIEHASDEDIGWLSDLEAGSYSHVDAVPKSVLMKWKARNPNGFFVLKIDGIRIGHIDFLAVKDAVFQLFCDGKIREVDISETELYGPDEKKCVRSIYVESIIIDPPAEYGDYGKDGSALKCVLSQFISMASEIAVLKNLRYVYAIAATKAGRKLLELLGFQILRGENERVDHHDLFRVKFADLASRICRIAGTRISPSDRKRIDCIIKKALEGGL